MSNAEPTPNGDSTLEDVRVGRARFGSGEVQGNTTPYHVIEIQTSQSYHLEWKNGGTYQRQLMTPGAVCVLPAQSPRFLRWRDNIELLWVTIEPSLLGRMAQGMEMAGSFEVFEQHGGLDPQLAHVASALIAEQEAKFPWGRLFSDQLTMAFCTRVLQGYAQYRPGGAIQAPTLSSTRWSLVRDFIEEHLDEELGLEELSRVANLSPYHFARAFKATVGASPHQYVISRRAEQARRLLRAGVMSPSQVAMECGFYDQSHLSRHMKRLLGLTPSQLRPTRRKRNGGL